MDRGVQHSIFCKLAVQHRRQKTHGVTKRVQRWTMELTAWTSSGPENNQALSLCLTIPTANTLAPLAPRALHLSREFMLEAVMR